MAQLGRRRRPVILMPADPEVRRLAEERRPMLEEVGARPILARLDAAPASMPLAPSTSTAIPVETPTSGS